MREFADWLKWAIRETHTTQGDVCRETGISTQTMSMYVNGRRVPKMETLYIICKALNVDFLEGCAAVMKGLDNDNNG